MPLGKNSYGQGQKPVYAWCGTFGRLNILGKSEAELQALRSGLPDRWRTHTLETETGKTYPMPWADLLPLDYFVAQEKRRTERHLRNYGNRIARGTSVKFAYRTTEDGVYVYRVE